MIDEICYCERIACGNLMRMSFRSIKAILYFLTLACVMSVKISYATDWATRFDKNKPKSACVAELAMTETRSVILGNVGDYVTNNFDSTVTPVSFNILLNHCPKLALKARAKFDGRLDRKNKEAFALGIDATALNVAVAIFEPNNHMRIPITTSLMNTELNSSIGFSSILTYQTKYVATDSHVESGTADAAIDFTVIYH